MYDDGAEGVAPDAGAPEIDLSCEEIAKAIYDSLCCGDVNAFMGDFSLDERVTIDGSFTLKTVADHLKLILSASRV